MSSAQIPQSEDRKKNSRRRKPSGGSRRRAPKKDGESSGEPRAPREPRVKVERAPSLPVPSDLVGKRTVGLVSAIVRRGRLKFGFISLGTEEIAENESVKIYFSFESLSDPNLFLRRGYPVEFTVNLDEKGRSFASDIMLTAAGVTVAAEREAAIAQRKLERGAEEKFDGPKKERAPREPRERKPLEEKPVVLKVTCEGKSEVKFIEFNMAQSVGKLKNIATTHFDAPVHYNVFHLSPAAPQGVFLTKSILVKLNTNDAIHLAEPKDVAPVAK